jgi:hypothetical protein
VFHYFLLLCYAISQFNARSNLSGKPDLQKFEIRHQSFEKDMARVGSTAVRSWPVCAFRGGAIGAEGFRLPDILPAFSRLRGQPALVANRGSGIGNSEESFDGAVVRAADRTRFRRHDKRVPILRQGSFSSKTDCASRNSQAQCAHNSPPDAAFEDVNVAGIGDCLNGSIAPRRAEWTPVARRTGS